MQNLESMRYIGDTSDKAKISAQDLEAALAALSASAMRSDKQRAQEIRAELNRRK